jgi:hypothetical protein
VDTRLSYVLLYGAGLRLYVEIWLEQLYLSGELVCVGSKNTNHRLVPEIGELDADTVCPSNTSRYIDDEKMSSLTSDQFRVNRNQFLVFERS